MNYSVDCLFVIALVVEMDFRRVLALAHPLAWHCAALQWLESTSYL